MLGRRRVDSRLRWTTSASWRRRGVGGALPSSGSPLPLTTRHTGRLEQALAAQTGGPVHLNVVVEPDLVGGVKVEIGDEVVDGTVRNRLADVERRLAGR